MLHKAWSSIEEVPYCFWRSSVKFQGHSAKKNRRFWPKLGVSRLKNRRFESNLSKITRPVAAIKSLRFALFDEMCRSASLVARMINTNLEEQKLRLRQHRPFMSIKSFEKHSRWDEWQDKVSFCSLIHFNWRVPARVPLFLLGLKVFRATAGGC